ncbi:MAG: hypothetical protein K2X03_22500 [Bryobacteraceae bacterium]|nr:hypothetical protein [Bryobacteraceae bacterium]
MKITITIEIPGLVAQTAEVAATTEPVRVGGLIPNGSTDNTSRKPDPAPIGAGGLIPNGSTDNTSRKPDPAPIGAGGLTPNGSTDNTSRKPDPAPVSGKKSNS